MKYIKHYLLFTLVAFCVAACSSPQTFLQTDINAAINQTMIDEDGETHLIGVTTRQGFQKAPFQEWFQKNYTTYEVKDPVNKLSKTQLKGVEVLAFMGTWCGDSKREVPRFYKVMDKIGFEDQNLKLVNVYLDYDRYKQSPTGEEKGLNIHRVPTFIFYKAGKEIGRIVESPATSMEIDIAQILHGIPSTPNYKVVAHLNNLYEQGEIDFGNEKMETLADKAAHYSRGGGYELNTYGHVLLTSGAVKKAITTFSINSLAYPDKPYTFSSLGKAYHKNGQIDLAIENYEKVLQMEPEEDLEKIVSDRLVALKKRE